MVYGSGTDPRTADLAANEICKGPGKLLIDVGTSDTWETTDATDVCWGVSAGDSSRDADKTYSLSGATVSYYPLGGVLMVQVEAASTFNIGDFVYVGGLGLATSTSTGNKKLGVYVGTSAHAATALVANGNSDLLTIGGGNLLASEGAMVAVNTSGADLS
ncbi:MAG: hypothetical protein HOC79_08905 [Euryarchaeota archaeon]|jgi:hypothetical protein|nr:hypothetical protein [Euryarchaeota archaeon]